ncbi:TPM domain-containing protein [Dysgonomonas sp. 216]|uniref:TPM domain-containing protein n=1 Tax=Dysgonomonas sp. 216 TaxID=2302934 RepID=UPI0013D0FC3F|nr:TPM domain-containing protein [Dysgonomonas sp. 216]NDW19559.1 TPM domain-containing protein [Dysgonomonas sp. 216]
MKLFSGLIFALFFFVHINIYGQNIPDPMFPPRLVNDFARIYTDAERNLLEQMLESYNDTTSTQIYVVSLSDLEGYDIADYAARLGEKWGIGQKGKDNGAVILIKPKTSDSRGNVFIATGYGLEPFLTDGRIGQILDNYMIPYLRKNDYYGGTKATVEVMIKLLSGEFKADKDNYQEGDSVFSWIFTLVLFILIIYIISKNNRRNDDDSDSSGGRGGWIPPFFPTRGGGFGGGSSSGGFGGGGGGRFGGGGAGRSWFS